MNNNLTRSAGARVSGRAALQALQQQLGKLAPKLSNAEQVTGRADIQQETVSDDLGPLEDAAVQQILREEQLVRVVLRLFDVDYDALIRVEGNSPYALAVQQQPQLLDQVRQADFPVLAAIQVALGYQPYADFTAKYGHEPDEIRAKLKAELREELKQERQQQEAQTPTTATTDTALPFTSRSTAAVPTKKEPLHRLEDIFSMGK